VLNKKWKIKVWKRVENKSVENKVWKRVENKVWKIKCGK
jgi:hypothetical protein